MKLSVAVTGATGFIGRNLLRFLSPHYRVKALVRPISYRHSPSFKVEWVPGDLSDMKALKRLLEGVGAVIHLAGAIKGRDYTDFARVNVKGFQNLLLAAEEVGVSKFLYISSLAAREPYLSPYAATKRQAEEFLAGSTLQWDIMRPPAVYGPFDRELTPLFRLSLKGFLPVFGDPENRFSLLYVEDLCEAILKWLEIKAPSGKIYELHDGKPGGYSWFEIREVIARIKGVPPKLLRVPKSLLKTLALGALLGGRLKGVAPMLTPAKVNELCHPDWTCDNTEITKNLGWSPRWPLEKALREWMLK